MTLSRNFGFAGIGGIRPTAMERAAGRIMRAPDHDGTGGGGADAEAEAARKAAEEAEATRKAAADEAAARKKTEEEAGRSSGSPDKEEVERLRREAAEAREALKRYEGIDPEKAKADAEKVAKAEADAREAERKKAEAEGNFERLRELQNEESQAAIKAAKEEAENARKEADAARRELQSARVDTAFANSKFIQEDTILTGSKAQRLFGEYVEVEDGKVVVYDAPRGEAKRAKVMDTKGNALPFDQAIKKVVDADPDKDTLLKTKTRSGASSSTTDGKQPNNQPSRVSRIAAGLKALKA